MRRRKKKDKGGEFNFLWCVWQGIIKRKEPNFFFLTTSTFVLKFMILLLIKKNIIMFNH